MHRSDAQLNSSIAIVIPCNDEEARISSTIRTIIDYMKDKSWSWEMIVVDDGSLDSTKEKALAAAAGNDRVSVSRYEDNHGKGWALRKGFSLSRSDYVLFCDADLSTPIDELADFLERAAEGYDLVVASRVGEQARILVPQTFARRLAGRAFRAAVGGMNLEASDTQCGFKLLRRATLEPVIEACETDGFAFDVELLLRAQLAGLRSVDYPVHWSDAAGSKLKLFRDGPRAIADLLRIRKMAKSLRRSDSSRPR